MIVDRRKDNYDELQILAGDTRNRRRKANMWTTGLVVSGMILASGYVSTVNEQAESLGAGKEQAENARDDAQKEADTKEAQLVALRNQLAVLTSERDIYRQNANWFANISPELKLSDAVSKLSFVVTGSGEKIVTEEQLANVVWVVDGSRRFPMADGDILWIPESNFWVQLESRADDDKVDPANPGDPNDPDNPPQLLRKVTFYYDRRPTNDAEGGKSLFLGGPTRYYEEKGRWAEGAQGSSNCVQLTLHYNSRRPGFSDPKYLDMEVLLYNSGPTPPNGVDNCPVSGHIIQDGEVVPR